MTTKKTDSFAATQDATDTTLKMNRDGSQELNQPEADELDAAWTIEEKTADLGQHAGQRSVEASPSEQDSGLEVIQVIVDPGRKVLKRVLHLVKDTSEQRSSEAENNVLPFRQRKHTDPRAWHGHHR
jgi:hypothetical protein